MVRIPVGKYVALVDDEFAYLGNRKWQPIESRRKDGTIRTVYAKFQIKKDRKFHSCFYMHRIILGLESGRPYVDHKNGNALIIAGKIYELHP